MRLVYSVKLEQKKNLSKKIKEAFTCHVQDIEKK